MPKVSIIVPIYNVEKYLERCMSSLLNQTLKDIEIILVDDGSPDNCPKMCDEYAKSDLRVKVIHKQNAGLGYARNSGLEIASGEYAAFVDSDDYVDVTMYESLYDKATESRADAVFCAYQLYCKGRKSQTYFSSERILHNGEIINYIADMIASPCFIKKERLECMSAWNGIYKKEIINKENVRFMSEREIVSEDILFNVDFLKHCVCLALIPQPLYFYCINGNSLSQTFKETKFPGIVNLYTSLIDKVAGYNSEDMKQRCNRLLVEYTLGQINNMFLSSLPLKKKKEIFDTIGQYKIWENGKISFNNILPKSQFLKFYLLKSRNFFLYKMLFAIKKILK